MTNADRKFQVANGYLLACDQLARALHCMLDRLSDKKISREQLSEATGLSRRQVESLVSIGAAMGLVRQGQQTLTPVGVLVAKHDIFLESKGTLEWCHYVAAGSHKNLIWYEVFNSVLAHEPPMTEAQWALHFRHRLAGQYSDRTLNKKLDEEIRFVTDGYLSQKFSKLGILQRTPDGKLYRRRYVSFELPIVAAMVYDYAEKTGTHLHQALDLSEKPGSPGHVFGVDYASFRHTLEALHERGWIRHETTHGLDQIRLKPDFTAFSLLQAYYEGSEPAPAKGPGKESQP